MPIANVKSTWESGNLIFTKVGTGATTGITFGEDATGLEFKVFGATTGKYMLWDHSANKLSIVGDFETTGAFTVTGAIDATSVESDSYSVGSTAGTDFSGTIATMTIVKGIVTAASA